MTFASMPDAARRDRLGGADRQLAGRARAGRRGRRDHALELPAAPDRGEGRAGARGRLHGRAQAERGRAARTRSSSPRSSTRPALPAGVFNLVTGTGPGRRRGDRRRTRASTWSRSPGSTRAGRRVSELASQTVKRVALELGGKSPNVILDDADLREGRHRRRREVLPELGPDLQRADADAGAARAGSRRPSAIAAAVADAYTVGDPFDGEHAPRAARVRRAARARARLHPQGRRGGRQARDRRRRSRPRDRTRGYFVRPTVFSDVTHRHDDRAGGDLRPGAVDHALRRRGGRGPDRQRHASTGSPAACGRATRSTRKRVARRIRTGQVEINGGVFNPLAPFGGYKQSGHGRELGRHRAGGVPPGEVDAVLNVQ